MSGRAVIVLTGAGGSAFNMFPLMLLLPPSRVPWAWADAAYSIYDLWLFQAPAFALASWCCRPSSPGTPIREAQEDLFPAPGATWPTAGPQTAPIYPLTQETETVWRSQPVLQTSPSIWSSKQLNNFLSPTEWLRKESDPQLPREASQTFWDFPLKNPFPL